MKQKMKEKKFQSATKMSHNESVEKANDGE